MFGSGVCTAPRARLGCRGRDGLPEEVRHERARAVLEQGWPAGTTEPLYGKENALHFCHYHSFKAGLLFLFQRMNDPTRQLQARPHPVCARLSSS